MGAKRNKMTKKQVINELETILSETRLSSRAGKYEALEVLNWFLAVGRPRLVALIERLKERRDGSDTGG
jgi:hypothetical protein